MVSAAPTRWRALTFARRLGRLARQPRDVPLLLRMGCFLWTAPVRLGRSDLPAFLARLGAARRPRAHDVGAGVARIARLRQALLRLPTLRGSNTCYVRALTLYRFLDPGDRQLRIHFGVEPGADPEDRLAGHAWITVDDEVIEPPDPLLQGRVHEIYCYPQGA